MGSIFSLIWYILNRGPFVLMVIAAGLFGAGLYFADLAEKREDRRATALANGPPPVVDIADFTKRRDVHDFNEVHVRAQLDFTMDYRLTLTGDGADDYAYMIPLVATDAKAGQDPQSYGILILDHGGFTFDDIDPLKYLGAAETFGAFGPVVTLNGFSGSLAKFEDIVDDSFAREGRSLPSTALILREYRNGRAAAFAPGQASEGQIFRIAALLFLGLAVIKTLSGRRPKQPVSSIDDYDVADNIEIPEPAMMTPRPDQSVPLWKQRDMERSGSKGVDIYKAKEPVKREREASNAAAQARTTSWVATAQSREAQNRKTVRKKGLSTEHRFAAAVVALLAILVVLPLYGTRLGPSMTLESGLLSSLSLPIKELLGEPTQMNTIESLPKRDQRNEIPQPAATLAPKPAADPWMADAAQKFQSTQGR
ncbi:hypothetical protein AAD018_017260 [Aestuariibius insulae]|uniref:hypothetical protein n=1 Tax=Aestuariibius insulae TaxID=2058287 RepID=UPI00345E3710